MSRLVVITLLATAATAHAGPKLHPPRDAMHEGDELVHIDRAGVGVPPDDSDEVTYRYDQVETLTTEFATHEEKSRRMTDENDRIRAHLVAMRPGERRSIWFAEQNGNFCDHFGCSEGPTSYAATLELVAVARHHDDLPDGMHIAAWPYLAVRRGSLVAPLPAEQIVQIDDVDLTGDRVTLQLISARFPLTEQHRGALQFTLDQLRARLADAEGSAQLARKHWHGAELAFTRAIALDPLLDAPYVHRATALLRQHDRPGASASIAPVAARNPAWLYWKVMADDSLLALRGDPVVRGLITSTAGTFDPIALYRCRECLGVAVEPTGRFLIAYTSDVLLPETGLAFGALQIIDRKTAAVIAVLPLDHASAMRANDGTSRCDNCAEMRAARQMLQDLGFSAPPPALKSLSYLDPQQGWPHHPQVFFDTGLELGLAEDRPIGPREFIEIAPPGESNTSPTKVVAAELLDDLVLYRWSTMGGIGEIVVIPRLRTT